MTLLMSGTRNTLHKIKRLLHSRLYRVAPSVVDKLCSTPVLCCPTSAGLLKALSLPLSSTICVESRYSLDHGPRTCSHVSESMRLLLFTSQRSHAPHDDQGERMIKTSSFLLYNLIFFNSSPFRVFQFISWFLESSISCSHMPNTFCCRGN